MKCPMCDKDLTGKQSYCSPACRKKASRQSAEGTLPESQEKVVEYNFSMGRCSHRMQNGYCIIPECTHFYGLTV